MKLVIILVLTLVAFSCNNESNHIIQQETRSDQANETQQLTEDIVVLPIEKSVTENKGDIDRFSQAEILDMAVRGKVTNTELLASISGVWEVFSQDQIVIDEQIKASLTQIQFGSKNEYSSPTSLIINCVSENKYLSVQGMYPKKIIGYEEVSPKLIYLYLETADADGFIYGIISVELLSEEKILLSDISSPQLSNGDDFYSGGYIYFGPDAIWYKFHYQK